MFHILKINNIQPSYNPPHKNRGFKSTELKRKPLSNHPFRPFKPGKAMETGLKGVCNRDAAADGGGWCEMGNWGGTLVVHDEWWYFMFR